MLQVYRSNSWQEKGRIDRGRACPLSSSCKEPRLMDDDGYRLILAQDTTVLSVAGVTTVEQSLKC